MKQLKEFLQSNNRNLWLECYNVNFYCRKQIEQGEVFLCLATISSNNPGKGNFKKLIGKIEGLGLKIMIENILTKRFYEFFLNRGYKLLRGDSLQGWTVIKNGRLLKKIP